MKLSKRHIAKAVTWRIIGSLDTLFLAWIISGNLSLGFKISGFEMFSKMILYYIHERVWFKSTIIDPNKRHLIKTVSWRVIGTLDTIVLGWVITGNPFTGIQIGGAETLTKMILYYGHEKLWYKLNFGLDRFKNRKNE